MKFMRKDIKSSYQILKLTLKGNIFYKLPFCNLLGIENKIISANMWTYERGTCSIIQ